jgi:hypothetical protein
MIQTHYPLTSPPEAVLTMAESLTDFVVLEVSLLGCKMSTTVNTREGQT